jgi:hydrogenase expression/formation protein HypC
MCIGWPLQVVSARPGRAQVLDDSQPVQTHLREVDTALIGDCAPGDWLLVFLDSARERLSAERAAEVRSALALVFGTAATLTTDTATDADLGFELPSRWSADDLRALTGQPLP